MERWDYFLSVNILPDAEDEWMIVMIQQVTNEY